MAHAVSVIYVNGNGNGNIR